MGKNMLKLSPLLIGYAGKPVLSFAGMELAHGSQCLLTGPSGSGKTTLLYAIAGLMDVMEGNIALKGTSITSLPQSARDRFRASHMGIVFQTLHLVKSLSVFDNLMLASCVAGLPQEKKRALELLERLGIADKKDAMPHMLSQGQAQRVAIARAVLHKPALLLADEPTSSLDDGTCAAVIELLKKLANETGSTLILSTHDNRVKPHFTQVISLGAAT